MFLHGPRPMSEPDDLTRLRQEYAARQRRLAESDRYSVFNPAHLFMIQQRQRIALQLLRQLGFDHLNDKCILEVGCGQGGVLLEYLAYGPSPAHLHGTDLLPDRLEEAHRRLPHLPLTCADGQRLPYTTRAFDLVLQYTVVSSILDHKSKSNLASEMLRVLKPGGLILWYDFWINPTNPQTRGIRLGEIKALFPSCCYYVRRVTLAPPITRCVVPISWLAGYLLEALPFLRTHYLVGIRKLEDDRA